MPAVATIKCTHCRSPMPWSIGRSSSQECPCCSVQLDVEIFPAVGTLPPRTVVQGVDDGTATCYFHDGAAANHACGQCGRFTCDLCSLRVGPHCLCPQCLDLHQHNVEVLPVGDKRVYEKIAFNVFLTKDELIHVENNMIGKRYIHMRFTDIQAIIMQRTPIILRLLGISCSLHLQNAVQTLRLPTIHTQRRAKEIIAKLQPKIEAHQDVPTSERQIQTPPPTPTPATTATPVTPYHQDCRISVNVAFHLALILFGAGMAARFVAPTTVIGYAVLSLFGASVFLAIGALIRQCRSNLPRILKAFPWMHLLVAIGTLKLSKAGIAATKFWVSLLPLLLEDTGTVPLPRHLLNSLQDVLTMPPTTSPLHLTVTIAGVLYGIGAGITGIVLLTVYNNQAKRVANDWSE
jgi:hypothetical protein